MKNNSTLAEYLAEHVEKENITSELFNIFNIDCLERCHIEPSHLDGLIKKIYESEKCDTHLLQEIIDFINSSQKDSQSKENELLK